jgi:hypothetical protein
MLRIAVDDRFTAFMNGHKVLSGSDWHNPRSAEVGSWLEQGKNVLAVEAENLPAPAGSANPAGLISVIAIDHQLRQDRVDAWRAAQTVADQHWIDKDFDDTQWSVAKVLGPYGMNPWGKFPQPMSYGPFTAAVGDEVIIIYVPQDKAIEVRLPNPHSQYTAEYFNPVTGFLDQTMNSTRTGDKPVAFTRKTEIDSPDWVLVLQKGK